MIFRLVADKIGGQRHHGRQLTLTITARQLVGDIKSRHVRQLDIQQEEIETGRIGQRQRLGTIARHRHPMAQLLQQGGGHRNIKLHILDQQDP